MRNNMFFMCIVALLTLASPAFGDVFEQSTGRQIVVSVGPTTPSGGTPPPATTVAQKSWTPVSGAQYGLTVASSTALTVPTGATYATVTVEGGTVRYTSDGATTPTATVGMGPFVVGSFLQLNINPLSNLKFIQSAGTATLDVEYFK